MRILFAAHGYKPAWRIGGPIISVSSVAERLVQRGHEVTVVTSNSNLDRDLDVPTDTPVDVEGVRVFYFEREELLKRILPGVSYLSQSIGFLYSRKMRARLDEIVPNVDIVHTHLPFNYPTYAAAHAAFRFKKPLIYHQRGVFDPARLAFRSLKKKLYLQLIERPILQRASVLIALTEAERESYRMLGVNTPCVVVPNGIETEQYSRAHDNSELGAVGIRADHLVVLFMGRIHQIKGADRLLEAFISIHDRVPNAVLVLAGPDECGLETSFRERAAHAGVTEKVIFTGMVEGALKKNLLARANLFCLPSAAEGFSIAVLEALASETAVLLSPGCYFPEVEHAGAGRIVGREVPQLAAALEEMLGDRNRLKEMGVRGRDLVSNRFTWDAVTDALLEVYGQVVRKC